MTVSTLSSSTDPAKGWVKVRDIPPPSEPAFILDNLIHEATTVMFGRPEGWKSYVALSMACSLVSGLPVSATGSASGAGSRCSAWTAALGVKSSAARSQSPILLSARS